ncbi:unnamed protein product [Leuciscus chuanchicus]
MEAMHEETLRRIQGVEKTVIENSNSMKQIISSLKFHEKVESAIPEKSGENVKQMIIDLFSQVSPSIAADLQRRIDIAYRLGPRSVADKSSRRIIVLFSSRSQRDTVWKDAKTSDLLREKKIKVFEDLSQKDKDAMTLLWPTVEKARREGKRAGFHGPFTVIEA